MGFPSARAMVLGIVVVQHETCTPPATLLQLQSRCLHSVASAGLMRAAVLELNGSECFQSALLWLLAIAALFG
jgi:hypothetical protein